MAALTTILGTTEIITGIEPYQMQRTYSGYAGIDGLTAMNLGTRGYAVPITGKLRVTGAATYAAARTAMLARINAIAALQSLPAAAYTYGGETYANAIFENFRLLPSGKTFHWHPDGSMTVDFTLTLRCLV